MVEYFGSNLDSLREFIFILSLHLPRALIFVFFFPLFGKGLGAGGFMKVALCAVLLLAPVSTMLASYDRPILVPAISVLTAVSEVVVGTLLGLTMAIPYYIFKAYGALIDIYRGATFAAQVSGNSDSGSEELPLESLFGLVFVALIMAGPGLHGITDHLMLSYLVLPPGQLDVVAVRPWAETLVQLLADHVVLAFLLAAPILIVILMVEVAMQIVSAFTPQMQVYSLQFGFRSIAAIAALLVFLNFSEGEVFDLMKLHSDTLSQLLQEVRQ